MNFTCLKGLEELLSSEWAQFGICMIVLAISVFLVRRLTSTPEAPQLPLLRRDMNVKELREYDGSSEDGRILVALNGNIYDVTKEKQQYLPGGLYASYAGRDCSRSLATYNLDPIKRNTYDDLRDLTPLERESIGEWEIIFRQKYDLVGRLLPPPEGEMPRSDHAVREHLELLNLVAEEVRRAELAEAASKEAITIAPDMEADYETHAQMRLNKNKSVRLTKHALEPRSLGNSSKSGTDNFKMDREAKSTLVLNALYKKLRETKLPPNVITIDHDSSSTEC